jgi:hypothetical protein
MFREIGVLQGCLKRSLMRIKPASKPRTGIIIPTASQQNHKSLKDAGIVHIAKPGTINPGRAASGNKEPNVPQI